MGEEAERRRKEEGGKEAKAKGPAGCRIRIQLKGKDPWKGGEALCGAEGSLLKDLDLVSCMT